MAQDQLTSQITPPDPVCSDAQSLWTLEPSIDFLNHGCFGARPKAVADAQARLREMFNARPIEMLDRGRHGLLVEPKKVIGSFIGMAPDDFGFVTNATGGSNAVLRSLRFEPGDELLTTNHVYPAVHSTMIWLAERAGATMRMVDVPPPLRSGDDLISALDEAISDRTRLLVIDHITSPTAVVCPVRAIIEMAAQRGVDVLVDGAHAPGQLELDIASLGAAYYTGNLHKWVNAPIGAAFLWVRKDRQEGIHPTIISFQRGEGLAREFEWQGTRDITPWICTTDALAFGETIPGGWPAIRAHNHGLATWAQSLLCAAWDTPAITPMDGSMIGSMATVQLPPAVAARLDKPEQLVAQLYDEHRIEIPVFAWHDRWWVRVSCQIYNRPEQYERLAEAVLSAR